MVKMLIDRGARINHKNKYGFSAYDYAMRAGNHLNFLTWIFCLDMLKFESYLKIYVSLLYSF